VLGGRTFEFDLGAPFVRTGDAAYPLVGAPYVARDTLFLHCTGSRLRARCRQPLSLGSWRRRLEETAAAQVSAPPVAPSRQRGATVPPPATLPLSTANPITGLHLAHTIVVDPVMAASIRATRAASPRRLARRTSRSRSAGCCAPSCCAAGSTWCSPLDRHADRSRRPSAVLSCRMRSVREHSRQLNAGGSAKDGSAASRPTSCRRQEEDQKRVTQMENDAMRFETTAPRATALSPSSSGTCS